MSLSCFVRFVEATFFLSLETSTLRLQKKRLLAKRGDRWTRRGKVGRKYLGGSCRCLRCPPRLPILNRQGEELLQSRRRLPFLLGGRWQPLLPLEAAQLLLKKVNNKHALDGSAGEEYVLCARQRNGLGTRSFSDEKGGDIGGW